MNDSESEEDIDYGDDDSDLLSHDSEQEILPSEDDDDDENDYGDRFSRFKIEQKKEEMASDIEDDNDDDDDGYLPDSRAWGSNKKLYYDTDFKDKDFRTQQQKDLQFAEYEEEEALQIQKRLLQSIGENDIGIDFLVDKTSKNDLPKKTLDEEMLKNAFSSNVLETLTEKQKIALVQQQSPELESLILDFKTFSKEAQQLSPLIKKLNSLKKNSGLKFLKLRYLILVNYCTNIAFYFSMKCSQRDKTNAKNHPIIKRLFTQKKLINELEHCLKRNPKFNREIDFAKSRLEQNKKLKFLKQDTLVIEDQTLEIDDDNQIHSSEHQEKIVESKQEHDVFETTDEKRAITYEIKKNKGLMPKRTKEQRNPRVKYRRKFEKAKVRRRGQVREPRKELKRYGGEMTGINVRAIKSVKFK